MDARWLLSLLLTSTAVVAGCAMDEEPVDDEEFLDDGKADGVSGVMVKSTDLDVDLATMTATATIELEKYGNVALEVGGLEITHVSDERGNRNYKITRGKLRVTNVRSPLVVSYKFIGHDQANGLLPGGSTVVWPYHCGNLFPCHSQPADGTTFALNLDNVPAGKTAVYPAAIETEAPPYMIAWAVGTYSKATLGTTPAGTKISVHWLPNGETSARAGTKNLVKVVDWFEKTLGPYAFGTEMGSVSVVWGEGLYGGMEHHPFFHVAKDAMNDEVTQAHEAAHGWFGDAVRLKCWEDFVLSEGTVSYLSARALSVVAPAMEAKIWADYQDELDAAIAEGGSPAWPRGCNQIDIVEDKLFTNLPYMQGAFFYKEVADKVGAEVLDGVIGRFYKKYKNKPAGMQDMVNAIKAETGFDPKSIVEARLRKQF
ncbi:MAG: M1 family aminopeptidase [Kofleriaceae bacterium]